MKNRINNFLNIYIMHSEPLFTINNVDDLLSILVEMFDSPICGEAEFQGDLIELGGLNAHKRVIEIYPWHKDSEIIFVISKADPFAHEFSLSVSKGGVIDQLPGCILPKNYLGEVIATIKGEW